MTMNDTPDEAAPPQAQPAYAPQYPAPGNGYQPYAAPSPYQHPTAPQNPTTYQNWAATGYLPPSYLVSPPKHRRIRRTPLILALAGLVAAIVLGGVTAQQFQASRSPRQIVQRYFTALSGGHAADALGFAASPPHSPYLTDSVLQEQLAVAKLSRVHIDNVSSQTDEATVNVDYTLALPTGSRLVHDEVPLVKRGSSWRLRTVAPLVNLNLASSGADRILVAGAKPPSEPIYLFPGAVPVDTDSSSVVVSGDPSVRLADDQQDLELTVGLTSAAKSSLTKALTTALGNCLNGKSTDANCPQVDEDRPVPGSLRGTVAPITSGISIALDSAGGGEVALTGEVTVKGSWKVWDFNNQAVAKSGTTDLSVHAIASVADVEHVFWSAS